MKLCALIAVAALGIALMETSREPLRAQMPAAAALTGRVTSVEEGAMEGVLVSARKAGSTITTTVVTDAQGRYRFPRTRLERRTWVDNNSTPVAFWVGGNHSASVVRVEPLETPPANTSDSR